MSRVARMICPGGISEVLDEDWARLDWRACEAKSNVSIDQASWAHVVEKEYGHDVVPTLYLNGALCPSAYVRRGVRFTSTYR